MTYEKTTDGGGRAIVSEMPSANANNDHISDEAKLQVWRQYMQTPQGQQQVLIELGRVAA